MIEKIRNYSILAAIFLGLLYLFIFFVRALYAICLQEPIVAAFLFASVLTVWILRKL